MRRAVSKADAGYESLPSELKARVVDKLGMRCDTCFYWIKGGGCKVVKGKIEADAACILYSAPERQGRVDLRFLSGPEAQAKMEHWQRMSKADAGYLCPLPAADQSKDLASFGCHTCHYFDRIPGIGGACFPVKGVISPHGCCNVWSHDGSVTSMDYKSGPELRKALMTDIEDLVCDDKHPWLTNLL